MLVHHILRDILLSVSHVPGHWRLTNCPFLDQYLDLILILLLVVSLDCSGDVLSFLLLLVSPFCSCLLVSWKTGCFRSSISKFICFLVTSRCLVLVAPIGLFHPSSSFLLVLVQPCCLPLDLFYLLKTYLSVSILIFILSLNNINNIISCKTVQLL